MQGNCCDDNKCGGFVYSSECVVYEGDLGPEVQGNKGDSLTSIIDNIITNIGYTETGNINVEDLKLSTCQIIKDKTGGSKDLDKVLQALIDSHCELKTYVENRTKEDIPSYDLKCLSPASNSEEDIIQSIINQTCSTKDTVTNLENTVEENTTEIDSIATKVAAIMGDLNSQDNFSFTFSQLAPPYVPMPYIGDLDNFDGNGKGRESKGFKNVYIMDGRNGTPDWRGYSPVGATTTGYTSSLDSRVTSLNLALSQKKGEVNHKLTSGEMPKHNHGITDLGHTHLYHGHKS